MTNSRLVFCKNGKLKGQRLTRYRISEELGLSHSQVSRCVIEGVFYERARTIKRFPVNGEMMTVREVLSLPDAPIMSLGSMRLRLEAGDDYRKPLREKAEKKEIEVRAIKAREQKRINDAEGMVVSGRHKYFCIHLAKFAAMRVLRC